MFSMYVEHLRIALLQKNLQVIVKVASAVSQLQDAPYI